MYYTQQLLTSYLIKHLSQWLKCQIKCHGPTSSFILNRNCSPIWKNDPFFFVIIGPPESPWQTVPSAFLATEKKYCLQNKPVEIGNVYEHGRQASVFIPWFILTQSNKEMNRQGLLNQSMRVQIAGLLRLNI